MTLTEQVFRKMGAEIKPDYKYKGDGIACWILNDKIISNSVYLDKYSRDLKLPPIDSQWEVCAKYLEKFMQEKPRSYSYHINDYCEFLWFDNNTGKKYKVEIKDDNIAQAACLAFMEVEL